MQSEQSKGQAQAGENGSTSQNNSEQILKLLNSSFHFCLPILAGLLLSFFFAIRWSLSPSAHPMALVIAFAALGLTFFFFNIYYRAMAEMNAKFWLATQSEAQLAANAPKPTPQRASYRTLDFSTAWHPPERKPYPWGQAAILATFASISIIVVACVANSCLPPREYQASTWLEAKTVFGRLPKNALADRLTLGNLTNEARQSTVGGQATNAADELLSRLRLIRSPFFLQQLWNDDEDIRALSELQGVDHPVTYLQDRFAITRFEKTNFYCITFRARSAAASQTVLARSMAKLFAKFDDDYRLQDSEEHRKFADSGTDFLHNVQEANQPLDSIGRVTAENDETHLVSVETAATKTNSFQPPIGDEIELQNRQVLVQLLEAERQLTEVESLPISQNIFVETSNSVSPKFYDRSSMLRMGFLAFAFPVGVVTLLWSITRMSERKGRVLAAVLAGDQ